VCDGIEKQTGIRPGVKWINDLVLNRRKLGGILTELSVDSKTGLVDYAIVGIGINCRHNLADFPEELHSIATSFTLEGMDVDPASLAASLIMSLQQMDTMLLSKKSEIMRQYRQDCITLGQDVTICRFEDRQPGKALDVDENGALVVQLPDGSINHVNSGEVSVRGLYSYI
jgi:BirA family biotin operon repressor/biotin-[acetyl-CoA-carboxylase] ligase